MNLKDIKIIINDFEKSELMSLDLETTEFKLKLSKRNDETVKIENNSEKAIVINEKTKSISNTKNITSPLVGTFYAAANPKEKPYVKVGQKVNKGDVVCIVEAMKIMNEIVADTSGVITEVMFSNEETVGFGDVLFKVDLNDSE